MLDTICSPVERNDILYQWKTDEHLLRRNGDCYNEFCSHAAARDDGKLYFEGIYFYRALCFFYNLSRNGRCPARRRRFAT